MIDISVGLMSVVALAMILVSAFFASTETALMSMNRYRLRHQAESGVRSARIAEKLLARPDRLIGVILLGNTFANFSAATLTAILALRLYGESGVVIATSAASIVMFICGDLAPKTFGALYPERLALTSAWIYLILDRLLYPIVWLANMASNSILRMFGIRPRENSSHSLSAEELRAAVVEARDKISVEHQRMLTSILDLESMTVDDIMIPRNDITAINAEDDWDDILEQLRTSTHTRLPVYEGSLNNIIGILHLKTVATHLAHGDLDKEQLVELAREREAMFAPSGTPLNTQLRHFRQQRRRVAMVVNEYGDVQGLITLEDLLEEIVGEFTTDTTILHRDIHQESNGSYVISGSLNLRTLNRTLAWSLPTDGPRTLNGLILEKLETIPEAGTSLKISNYSIEILQVTDNTVRAVRVRELS